MNLSAQRLKQRGSALIIVLLSIALLFSLGVPFLLTSRLRSQASQEVFDRSQAQIAIQSATRVAMHHQAGSHPSEDTNPLWDSSEEYDPAQLGPLPQSLGDDWERSRQAWGIEAENAQARVSLSSSPPMLLQSLLNPCFVTTETELPADELPVTTTAGFPEEGFIHLVNYSRRNLDGIVSTVYQYTSKTPNSFMGLQLENEEEGVLQAGQAIVDLRILNLVLARQQIAGEHSPPEFLNDIFGADLLGAGLLQNSERNTLERLTWFYSGTYGGDTWAPGTLLLRPINPERTDLAVVSDGLAFGPGTVVRVDREGGDPIDTFVLRAGGGNRADPNETSTVGGIVLAAELPPDLEPIATRVYPLRREPVDINACRPEILEALLTGLRWNGNPPVRPSYNPSGSARRTWIRPGKARDIAEAIVQARPLKGPEDFWERILVPMRERGSLSDMEAWLVYLNSLDPNNSSIGQSTLPFGYRSANRYIQRVNAAVRSRLGRTQARASVTQVIRAAPSGPLLRVWRTQEEFDDLTRFSKSSPGVMSLPNNLGRVGGLHDFPNALTLRTGANQDVGLIQAAKRDEDAYLTPEPIRELLPIAGDNYGRIRHFDFEANPMGYDISERGPFDQSLVEWDIIVAASANQGAFSSNEPIHLQGWFFLDNPGSNQYLFDLYGPEIEQERLYAAIENGQLVVRMYGNAGQDLFDEDNLTEAIEVKVDPVEYPLENRWVHLSALVRGNSPRGLQVAIDGVPHGEVGGLTYLQGALGGYAAGSPDDTIVVESTEGFPNRGVIRIGDEVIEYSSKTGNTFITDRVEGPNEYIGGRAAREGKDVTVNILDSDHPSGAAVERYGYSAILDEGGIPIGGGVLSGDFGPWSFARVVAGEDPISVNTLFGQDFQIGSGINCNYIGDIQLEAIAQAPEDTYYADAFQTDGGYALMVQYLTPNNDFPSTDNCPLFGAEVVRYSARQGTTITLSERGVELPNIAEAKEESGWLTLGARSYVTNWELIFQEDLNENPDYHVYIFPISVKGTGVSEASYLPGSVEHSEFVQITVDGDAGKTEWVRYDTILNGCFIRDDWTVLSRGIVVLLDDRDEVNPPEQGGGGGGGGGGPGGGNGGGGPGKKGGPNPSFAWVPPPRPISQEPAEEYGFMRTIGREASQPPDIIQEVRRAFKFRQVMGTFTQEQQAGARLVPVFKTYRDTKPSSGFVGRLDRVAVMQDIHSTLPPSWFTVQWAIPSPPEDDRLVRGRTYVAFYEDPGLPFLGGINQPDTVGQAGQNDFDIRLLSRLVKFPSGERPIRFEQLSLGGGVSPGARPMEGIVDEFAVHTVSGMGDPVEFRSRGAFVLEEDLAQTESNRVSLSEYALIRDGRRHWAPNAGDWFQDLPTSGILDIDGERIAFTGLNPGTGEIEIAPNGRGLHGTEPRGHSAGAYVYMVDGRAASALNNDLTPGESWISMEDAAEFPDSGLILINEELIHTSFGDFSDADSLGMPRRRGTADNSSAYGDGIFRGRFGTRAADHSAGSVAYSMPCRFKDGYVPQSNSPMACWYEIGLNEPNAYWRGLRYETELPHSSHKIRVLARSGPGDWEGAPGSPGLVLIEEGSAPGGGLQRLELNDDRLDLRVTFDWDVGAFDPINFTAIGWTQAPRLRDLLVDYLAESRLERWNEVLE